MARIFVSYRRDDAASEAGRITDWLDRHFGEDEVFMDVNTLEPGTDFVQAIKDTVESIDALIAVIGPSWVDAKDEQGRRRLDDSNDVVRLEIANALRRGIRVIPVLVEGAAMPRSADLPVDMQPLLRRNALQLTNLQWRPAIQRLIDALDGIVTVKPQPPQGRDEAAGGLQGAQLMAALVGAALLLCGVFVKNSNRESFLRPRFGGAVNFHDSHALWRAAGVFTTLPTVGIAVTGLAGALIARRTGNRHAFGVGFLAAAGLQGTALYAGVLSSPAGHELGFALPLLGGLAVVSAAAWPLSKLLRKTRRHTGRRLGMATNVGAVGGATIMLVGMVLNFNDGGPAPEHRYADPVLNGHHVERWDLLLIALLALLIPPLATVLASRAVAAGALVGCGIGALCAWPRFIAIPLMENRELASLGIGGLVGLAGAALILAAGLAARRPADELAS